MRRKWLARILKFCISVSLFAAAMLFSIVLITEDFDAIALFNELVVKYGVLVRFIAVLAALLLILLAYLMLLSASRRKVKVPTIQIIAPEGKSVFVDKDKNPLPPPASGENDGEENGETPKESEPEELQESRFYMLTETDARMENAEPPIFNDKITLSEICETFRSFAASKLGLYYDISVIREFIASLSVSKILIMQGMSGTGKTSLAYAYGEFLKNKSTIVPIQPMWKERTDLIGYYNEFTKRFNETVLLQKMYEANYSQEMYITVLDEMNIARVEYYFAEFLSLLEIPNPEGRYLDVVSDVWENDPKKLREGQIKLPENMWFIGTANNDDSTFSISDKVYDRAMVMNLDKKTTVFDAPPTDAMHISTEHWESLVASARREYAMTNRNRRRIAKLDAYMVEKFKITFGNRIMKQINTYVPVFLACGGDEIDAIDDILSKKVLRKLESYNPIYVRNAAEGFRNYLDELFGYDRMKKCKEYLLHLEKTA